ncbi:hypothetical protein Ciccas_004570 [Cichlidogyrus casuarinus]|uniref:Uncharacterized protein n=1 Tax=Cichlidogyrus casuarinus TaxID=1844966 RepID=A0ABD2QC33_9PLAT
MSVSFVVRLSLRVKEKIAHEELSVELQQLKDRLCKHSLENANREDHQRDISESYESRMERLELQLKVTLEKSLLQQREHAKALESQVSAYRRQCLELKNTLNARTRALETMRDRLHQEVMGSNPCQAKSPLSCATHNGTLPLDSVTSSSGLGSSLPHQINTGSPPNQAIDSFHELDAIDSSCGMDKSSNCSSSAAAAGPLLILHLKDRVNELERENARLEIDLETMRINVERYRLMLEAKGVKVPESGLLQLGSISTDDMLMNLTAGSLNGSEENSQEMLLQDRYNKVVSHNAKLEVELTMMKSREQSSSRQQDKAHVRIQELEKQIASMSEMCESQRSSIESYREECGRMQDINNQLTRDNESTNEQLREARANLKRQKSHVQTLQLENERLRVPAVTTDGLFYTNCYLPVVVLAEETMLQRQTKIENELRASRMTCERANQEIEELQGILRDTRRRYKESEAARHAQFEEFTQMESSMIRLGDYVSTIKSEYERLTQENRRLTQENRELVMQLQSLLTQNQELVTETWNRAELQHSEKSLLQ